MELFCVISANSGSFRAHCIKVHVRYLISWWVLVKMSQHLAKLQERKLIAWSPCVMGTVLLKNDEVAWDLTYGGQELLQQRHITIVGLSNLDPWLTSIKLVYCQPLAWLVDWCHQWLNVNHVRRHFVTTSFFLVVAGVYSRPFCGFFSAATVNIFGGEHNDANVTGWILFSNCLEWLSLARRFASLSYGSFRFLSTSISPR